MDYFYGLIFGYLLLYLFVKYNDKTKFIQQPKIKPIRYSQSHIHSLISPLLPKPRKIRKVKKSQSDIHNEKNNIKVIIMDDSAYWIKDNTFYVADMSNGYVDKETTRKVDTDNMSKVQLDRMLFILDKLREGIFDDSGSAGD